MQVCRLTQVTEDSDCADVSQFQHLNIREVKEEDKEEDGFIGGGEEDKPEKQLSRTGETEVHLTPGGPVLGDCGEQVGAEQHWLWNHRLSRKTTTLVQQVQR